MKLLRKWFWRLLLCALLLSILILLVQINRQTYQRTLNHALIEAIKKRQTPQAIRLLDEGADANTRDIADQPTTLKSVALDLWRKVTGVEPANKPAYYPPALLLIYPQDWRFHFVNDKTLVDNGKLVQALLDHGADPNVRTEWGDLLVHLSAMQNHSQTVKVLLEHHVDPNVRAFDSTLPLMWTAPNDTDCAHLLIAHGADVNACDSWQETPLMWTWSCQTCQLLIDHGADINAKDRKGQTALMRDVVDEDYQDSLGNKKMHWLLRHGARVNIRDKSGKTALQYAHASQDLSPAVKKELISLLEEAAKRERVQ